MEYRLREVQMPEGTKTLGGEAVRFCFVSSCDADEVIGLDRHSPETAPKGVPVLVAGGVAMRKTGGDWYSGMEEPAFTRQLQWEPKWWAHIPTENE